MPPTNKLPSSKNLKNEILKVVRACLIISYQLSNQLLSLDEVFFLKFNIQSYLNGENWVTMNSYF